MLIYKTCFFAFTTLTITFIKSIFLKCYEVTCTFQGDVAFKPHYYQVLHNFFNTLKLLHRYYSGRSVTSIFFGETIIYMIHGSS